MKTKIQLIDRAYSKLRISGLTVNPLPEEVVLALDEMECMIAEWDLVNVCLGYQFEEEPDPNSESGLIRGYENAVQSNLALRLAPDFGKPSADLMRQASQSYSKISSATAVVKPTPYSPRQPIGEANTLRWNQWQRYYRVDEGAPNDCSTEIMSVNDVTDSQVNYDDYLVDDDSIASMTMDSTNGLDIEYSEFDSSNVSFRVKATKAGTQMVKISIVTANGLEKTNCLYYSVVRCLNAGE